LIKRSLIGTERHDDLKGTNADDVIKGRRGNDEINGRGGNDSLYGGSGDDKIYGGLGNDRLEGGHGNDKLDGGAGDDWLIGGAGDDRIVGGSGIDTAVFSDDRKDYTVTLLRDGSIQIVSLTEGNDIIAKDVEFFSFAGVTYNRTDVLVPPSDPVLNGTESSDFLSGGDSAEIIDAQGGSDYVWAGGGNDTVIAGAGDDNLFGGAGNDTLVFSGNRADYVFDQVFVNLNGLELVTQDQRNIWTGGVSPDGNDLFNGFETFTFADQTMTLNQLLASLDETVVGTAGDDRLNGGYGNDVVLGLNGDDLLMGSTGDDRLNGGAGNDTLIDVGLDTNGDGVVDAGGYDIAEFSGNRADYTVIQTSSSMYSVQDNRVGGGDGYDTVIGLEAAAFADGTVTFLELVGGPRNLVGTAGDDVLNGTDGNDRLDGGDGNDVLDGSFGDDVLIGGAGDDVLYGGAGTNTFIGGDGNDYLDLEGTLDTATGGAGADIFRVVSSGGFSVITDFTIGEDRVNASGIGVMSGFVQNGANAQLTVGSHTYEFLNVDATQMSGSLLF
jgi:Ca2+-binding RTX toxin-like protein